MTATEIFIQFEKMAIEWGKRHQVAKVGEIVISKGGGKREKKYLLHHVFVTTGRNAEKTTDPTLVIMYTGRLLDKKGVPVHEIGQAKILFEFRTEDGRTFSHQENGVTEFVNDTGLSFSVDFDPEAAALFPAAYRKHGDQYFNFSYHR